MVHPINRVYFWRTDTTTWNSHMLTPLLPSFLKWPDPNWYTAGLTTESTPTHLCSNLPRLPSYPSVFPPYCPHGCCCLFVCWLVGWLVSFLLPHTEYFPANGNDVDVYRFSASGHRLYKSCVCVCVCVLFAGSWRNSQCLEQFALLCEVELKSS